MTKLEELNARMRFICIIGALLTIIAINFAGFVPGMQYIPLWIIVFFSGVVIVGGSAMKAKIEYDKE